MWTILTSNVGSGGGGGGGSDPFLMEAASIDDVDASFQSTSVPQRHMIDVDGNGSGDAEMESNFLVYGADYDSNGLPDIWENMKSSGRAWAY